MITVKAVTSEPVLAQFSVWTAFLTGVGSQLEILVRNSVHIGSLSSPRLSYDSQPFYGTSLAGDIDEVLLKLALEAFSRPG